MFGNLSVGDIVETMYYDPDVIVKIQKCYSRRKETPTCNHCSGMVVFSEYSTPYCLGRYDHFDIKSVNRVCNDEISNLFDDLIGLTI